MMATVPQVTSGSGLRKFQAVVFLLDRLYIRISSHVAIYNSCDFRRLVNTHVVEKSIR